MKVGKKLVEGIDFYWNDKGYKVLTKEYHLERGYCCGSGCINCAFDYVNVKNKNLIKVKNNAGGK